MTTEQRADRMVGLGQSAVIQGSGTLAVLGLGSCVAVLLYDPDARVGGLVHVVLPTMTLARDRSNPARFAGTAVPHLLHEMGGAGARRERIRVWLVGGASMFANLIPAGTSHMGQRNVMACRTAVRAAELRVAGEAVGGEAGRSVWFDVEIGKVTVRRVGHEPEVL